MTDKMNEQTVGQAADDHATYYDISSNEQLRRVNIWLRGIGNRQVLDLNALYQEIKTKLNLIGLVLPDYQIGPEDEGEELAFEVEWYPGSSVGPDGQGPNETDMGSEQIPGGLYLIMVPEEETISMELVAGADYFEMDELEEGDYKDKKKMEEEEDEEDSDDKDDDSDDSDDDEDKKEKVEEATYYDHKEFEGSEVKAIEKIAKNMGGTANKTDTGFTIKVKGGIIDIDKEVYGKDSKKFLYRVTKQAKNGKPSVSKSAALSKVSIKDLEDGVTAMKESFDHDERVDNIEKMLNKSDK